MISTGKSVSPVLSTLKPLPVSANNNNHRRPSQQTSSTQQQHHSPGRILDWVNRLERINANLDDHGDHCFANDQLVKNNQADESDLCFKTAQLATEFFLMLFAASLLIIVAIVIFSKKIPEFMESYEIVPKFLFFLCVFVALYSFSRWLMVKSKDWIKGSSSQGISEILVENRRILASKDGQKRAHLNDTDCQQQQLPLLTDTEAHYDQDKVDQDKFKRFNVSIKTCPPLRQVAFDPSHLLNETDEEEVDRSIAST